MRYVRWLAMGLVVCSLAATSGQDVPDTVTLRATVTDVNGVPIAGATVIVLDGPRTGADGKRFRTDPEGKVDIPGVSLGAHRLNVHADGFVSVIAREIMVGPGRPIHELSFVLQGQCQVFGRVTVAPEGLPPPTDRVIVSWHVPGTAMGGGPLELSDEGEFTLTATSLEYAELAVRIPGYSWVVREVGLEADGIIDNLEFVLEDHSGLLSGKVIGPDGTGIPHAPVGLLREDVVKLQGEYVWDFPVFWHADNESHKCYTDGEGAFRLEDVPAGRYYLAVGKPETEKHRGHTGPMEVKPGGETADVTVYYDPSPDRGWATFVGTLRDLNGRPLPNHDFAFTAQAYRRTPDGRLRSGGGAHGTARSGLDGRFAVLSEAPCDVGQISIGGDGVMPILTMNVEADERGIIDVDRLEAREVTGVAFRDSPANLLAGREVRMRALGESPNSSVPATTWTDADGRLGPLKVDRQATCLWVGLAEPLGYVLQIDLPPGDGPTAIEAAFPALGSVAGTIGRDGKPLHMPTIVRVQSREQKVGDTGVVGGGPPVGDGPQVIVPAGKSEWELGDLEPGHYMLMVDGTGLLFPPGVEVDVAPGNTAVSHIDVPKAVKVAGRIVAEGGAVPPGARLSGGCGWLTKPSTRELPANADGTFAFDNMPAAKVRLSAGAPGYEWASGPEEIPEEGIPNLEFRLKRKR